MDQKGLRPIAIFEALKGVLALLVGLGMHEMSNASIQQGAEYLVSHLHLNPASHYPSIFISSVGKLDSSNIEVKFSENNAGYVAVFDDVKSA